MIYCNQSIEIAEFQITLDYFIFKLTVNCHLSYYRNCSLIVITTLIYSGFVTLDICRSILDIFVFTIHDTINGFVRFYFLYFHFTLQLI